MRDVVLAFTELKFCEERPVRHMDTMNKQDNLDSDKC